MWQRFTERARKVVFYAQEEAGRLGENNVSTEHLLLGLLRENDTVAARILDRIGIAPDRIRAVVGRRVVRGDGVLGENIQLTASGKRVIDFAYEEARLFNNNYIGTEHILLGLIRVDDEVAGSVLAELGIGLGRTRQEVRNLQQEGEDGKSAKTNRITWPWNRTSKGAKGEASGNAPGDVDQLRNMATRQIYQATRIATDAVGVVEMSLIETANAAADEVRTALGGSDVGTMRAALHKLNEALLALSKDFYDAPTVQSSSDSVGPTVAAGSEMLQRFTTRARKTMELAQEEARNLGESYVSTEHILLGLVRETDNVAIRVLERMGIAQGTVLVEVERQVARGGDALAEQMQMTPRAQRVIDLAFDEARQLNNNYIGTEHLLLGLIREREGLAGRILAKLGAELERTRWQIRSLQEGGGAQPPREVPSTGAQHSKPLQAVIANAREMAGKDGLDVAEPWHFVRALLVDPSTACGRLLVRLSIDPASITITPVEGADPERIVDDPPPLSFPAHNLLREAEDIGRILNEPFTRTDHLFVALLEIDDFTIPALSELGLKYRKVLGEIRNMRDDEG